MAIEPSGQFSHLYEGGEPSTQRYSPSRPNTFYKGDPASDNEVLDRALDARSMESYSMDPMAAATGATPKEGQPTNEDVRNNAQRINGALDPMTVGEAQDAAEAGNPITGDADAVARYSEHNDRGLNIGSLTEDLDEVNDARDQKGYAKDEAIQAASELEDAQDKHSSAIDNQLKKENEHDFYRGQVTQNIKNRRP